MRLCSLCVVLIVPTPAMFSKDPAEVDRWIEGTVAAINRGDDPLSISLEGDNRGNSGVASETEEVKWKRLCDTEFTPCATGLTYRYKEFRQCNESSEGSSRCEDEATALYMHSYAMYSPIDCLNVSPSMSIASSITLHVLHFSTARSLS